MKTDGQNIRYLYRDLLNDVSFEKLELQLQTPNIFQILNISRAELRHSSFLKWLLDPNENHGLGKMFLLKFLREVATSETASEVDELEIPDLNFNNIEIRREWKNIDLLILFDSTVFCIENKIDTKDHSNQLSKYKQIIESHFPNRKKVFVYLTPFGDDPLSSVGKEHYVLYSYNTIIEHLEYILEIHKNSINPNVVHYIKDYVINLRRDLMKNGTINDLAGKIYKNHKELIDFIIENKPDLATNLYPEFEKWFKKKGMIIGSKNKGFLKFTTSNLDKITPRKGIGWPLKENFLFELDFFWNKKNKIILKSIITPGDQEVKDILIKAIQDVKGAKIPSGNKWIVHFQMDWKFNKEDHIDDIDEESIYEMLENQWPVIKELIDKVEESILKSKDLLLELKSK